VIVSFAVVTPLQRRLALSRHPNTGPEGELASQGNGRVTPGYTKLGGKATLFPLA